jgi:hypothetical protein
MKICKILRLLTHKNCHFHLLVFLCQALFMYGDRCDDPIVCNHQTWCCSSNDPELYMKGIQFKSWLGSWLSWWKFFVLSSVSLDRYWDNILCAMTTSKLLPIYQSWWYEDKALAFCIEGLRFETGWFQCKFFLHLWQSSGFAYVGATRPSPWFWSHIKL